MTNREELFKHMHPMKAQIMKELEEKAAGKGMKSSAPLIMEAMQKLKANNLSFTPEEISVMMEVLTKDMSPEEKQRVEMMKQVVKNKGKKT